MRANDGGWFSWAGWGRGFGRVAVVLALGSLGSLGVACCGSGGRGGRDGKTVAEPAEVSPCGAATGGRRSLVLKESLGDVAGFEDRVGFLFPWNERAKKCWHCSNDGECTSRPGCTVGDYIPACKGATKPGFEFVGQPSFGEGCTVIAVGKQHVLTVEHCTHDLPGKKVVFGHVEGLRPRLAEGTVDDYVEYFPLGKQGSFEKDDSAMKSDLLRYCPAECNPNDRDETERLALLRLTKPHGRPGPRLECADLSDGIESAYSLGHPLGGSMVRSDAFPDLPVYVWRREVHGRIFHQVGNSGSPLFDEHSKLAGVNSYGSGRWAYCSASGRKCADSLVCQDAECEYAGAVAVDSTFCKRLDELESERIRSEKENEQ